MKPHKIFIEGWNKDIDQITTQNDESDRWNNVTEWSEWSEW